MVSKYTVYFERFKHHLGTLVAPKARQWRSLWSFSPNSSQYAGWRWFGPECIEKSRKLTAEHPTFTHPTIDSMFNIQR
jgi:hypothetical protein